MRSNLLVKIAPAIVALGLWLPAATAHAQVSLSPGDLIKMACPTGTVGDHPCRGVYYFGANGKRYVFTSDKSYFTWYSSFTGVKSLSVEQLGGIPLGGNVTYRPGVKMIKITSDPKVYVVSKSGILRAIPSEGVAATLYGADWNKKIDDVSDAFFINYQVGLPLTTAADFDKIRITNGVPSINVDKVLTDPPLGYVDHSATNGFSPTAITVPAGTIVTWISLDSSLPLVASDPHPTHTQIPGFTTMRPQMGGSTSFTFNQAGTWGVHNHDNPSQHVTITVQ